MKLYKQNKSKKTNKRKTCKNKSKKHNIIKLKGGGIFENLTAVNIKQIQQYFSIGKYNQLFNGLDDKINSCELKQLAFNTQYNNKIDLHADQYECGEYKILVLHNISRRDKNNNTREYYIGKKTIDMLLKYNDLIFIMNSVNGGFWKKFLYIWFGFTSFGNKFNTHSEEARYILIGERIFNTYLANHSDITEILEKQTNG